MVRKNLSLWLEGATSGQSCCVRCSACLEIPELNSILISARAFALPLASYFASSRDSGGVVIDDRIRDQPCALVADLDFDVGPAGQLLLAADLGDGRA